MNIYTPYATTIVLVPNAKWVQCLFMLKVYTRFRSTANPHTLLNAPGLGLGRLSKSIKTSSKITYRYKKCVYAELLCLFHLRWKLPYMPVCTSYKHRLRMYPKLATRHFKNGLCPYPGHPNRRVFRQLRYTSESLQLQLQGNQIIYNGFISNNCCMPTSHVYGTHTYRTHGSQLL